LLFAGFKISSTYGFSGRGSILSNLAAFQVQVKNSRYLLFVLRLVDPPKKFPEPI